jgi:hypothetical protein
MKKTSIGVIGVFFVTFCFTVPSMYLHAQDAAGKEAV